MAKTLAKMMPEGRLRRHRPRSEGNRPPSYLIPPLEECRAAFLTAMKIDCNTWFDDDVAGGQGWPGLTETPGTAERRGSPEVVRGVRVDRRFSGSFYDKQVSDRDHNHRPEHDSDDHVKSDTISCSAQIYPDHPDHPDQASKSAACNGQGCATDPGPPRPGERLGACAYCRDAVYRDDVVHAAGRVLHHRCVAVWSKA